MGLSYLWLSNNRRESTFLEELTFPLILMAQLVNQPMKPEDHLPTISKYFKLDGSLIN
ncbi:hypothetical protein LBR02_20700 [Levilactobacillus brevis]|nr:hypothetical protein LBR02_20700 [Levilactobacillus brevis]